MTTDIQTVKKASIKPNGKQQECIDTIDGKVMVLAGPGTGKTFTLTKRVRAMLERGIAPSKILCLTFSDAAANEMRAKLMKEMGPESILASRVDIYTYHAFCSDIIKQNPEQFKLSDGVDVISDTMAIKLMKESIDEAGLEYFVPPNAGKYFYAKKFIDLAKKIKDLRINEKTYMSYIDTNLNLAPEIKRLEDEIASGTGHTSTTGKPRKLSERDINSRKKKIEDIKLDIEKAKELWKVCDIFTGKMRENNLIDFSDMINLVLDEFEGDDDFLQKVASSWEYFLADEYQDTNALQNLLIFKLLEGVRLSDMPENIFVVGDDDQIIYGFQGAKNDNLENFLKRYPDTKVICLCENNRSAQNILDLSYLVVSEDDTRLENNPEFEQYGISKRLSAANEKIVAKAQNVRQWQFGDVLQEYNAVADDIEKLVNSPKCPADDKGEKKLSEIAVLLRGHKEISQIASLLRAKNIPYQLKDGVSIFTIRSSIVIWFYIKALNNHVLCSDKLFGLLLTEPFNFPHDDYQKLLEAHWRNRKSNFIDNMRALGLGEDFLKTFDYLREYSATNNLRNTVVEIVNRTGILECYFRLDKNRAENIAGIKKLIDEAIELCKLNPAAGLNDFVAHLDEALENDIEINTEKSDMVQNAVQLTTYHSSKGREFEHVYLPSLTNKAWEEYRGASNKYKLITDEVLDDALAQKKKDTELAKLLFVGITRAKYALALSFSDNAGKSSMQITKYLTPALDFNFDKARFEFNEEEYSKEYVRSVLNSECDNKKAFERELKERVKTLVLSPSAMAEYFNCPKQFLYKRIFNIEVKDGNWDAANYGTAIHSVLEKAADYAKKNGSYRPLSGLLEDFRAAMDREIFSSVDVKEKNLNRGIEELTNYYPKFIQTQPEKIEVLELDIRGIPVGEDTICGKIDRVDKNQDGTYSLIDYKTGEPVSEKGVCAGGTAEKEFNQLCFYKYIYEKSTNNKVTDATLVYLKGQGKSICKTLHDADMARIESLIEETYKNIKALNFEKPEKVNCEYCNYKHLCRLEAL